MTPNSNQLSLLRHTLGLSPERGVRTPYRNHFVAGAGHQDMPHLESLEAAGLMERRHPPTFLNDGDIVFASTDAGKELAIASLPPEPKRTRYEEFLRTDCDESFGEFLCGGRLPKFEYRQVRTDNPWRVRYEYRMFRNAWCFYGGGYHEVEGEWKPTKKEAKASYKIALAARRAKEPT